MATNPHYRLLTAEEFLEIRFPPDMKAELEYGIIRIMAGGSRAHARVQMNLYRYLSPTTREHDLKVIKLEYRELDSVSTIAFVDPDSKTLSVSQRIAGGWTDSVFAPSDLSLPDLGITVPHAEIFAED